MKSTKIRIMIIAYELYRNGLAEVQLHQFDWGPCLPTLIGWKGLQKSISRYSL